MAVLYRAMSDKNRWKISRRNVLQSVSGTAAAGGMLSASTGSALGEEDNELLVDDFDIKDVQELNGREKNQQISKSLRDNGVKSIRNELVSDGITPRRNDAKAWITIRTEDKPDFYTVQIPFKTPEDNGKAYIIWSSNENIPTTADYYPDGTSGNDSQGTEIITYRIEESSVIRESETITQSKDEVQVQTACNCGDYDWECVALTAAVAGAGSGECSTCVGTPAKWNCVACASALIAAGINLKNCCNSGWFCWTLNGPLI